MKDARLEAELHWDYTGKIIALANPDYDEDALKLMKGLYVEAFMHGIKHALAGDYEETK